LVIDRHDFILCTQLTVIVLDKRGTVGALPARDRRVVKSIFSTPSARSFTLEDPFSARQGKANVSAFAWAARSPCPTAKSAGFELKAAVKALFFLESIPYR
jgi:hypothetical protein